MRPAPNWRECARFPVTAATVVLATAVSLAWWAGAEVSFLFADPRIRRGEVWRLLTSALPHVNVLHLVFNVYWVWAFGTRVEGAFGRVRAAAVFALLAVVSGAAEYAVFRGGVGLSGVGYGLFGFFWVLRRGPRFADVLDGPTIALFVVWFFVCIVATQTGAMAVANVAHGVGALVGVLLGAAVRGRSARRGIAAGALALTALASLAAATVWRGPLNFSAHPGAGEARLGYEALETGRNEEALRWLKDATTLEPEDAGSWFNLAIAYQRTGRLEEAAAAHETARRLEAKDPTLKDRRGKSPR